MNMPMFLTLGPDFSSFDDGANVQPVQTGKELSESLVEQLLQFDASQFVYSEKFPNLRTALTSGPGILDLFSGARGFARQMVQFDTWALCFDLKHSPAEDLLAPWLQHELQTLLRSGAFVAMAASPVRASFSTAITPPWRTVEFPAGRPGLSPLQRAKIKLGQSQLKFVLNLVDICLELGLIFWVENPDGSWFWKQRGQLSWSRILERPEVNDFRVDQCRFGTSWRKRTRFRTNSHLGGQSLFCACCKPHTVLRGRCKARKVNYTKLAESYPTTLAAGVGIDCGLAGQRRKLDINSCARCGLFRIGEASHPGPRGPRKLSASRPRTLDDVQMLEPQTVAMRKRFWSSFVAWLETGLGERALEECLAAPILLVTALESYGHAEYAAGTPLHYYRQLLAHAQREFPLTRPYMSVAWNLVSKWQSAEPVQHRPPLPEPLARSMAALAISWRWPLFSAALLLCFYGICRIGEVMKARRRDLLTPEDLLSDDRVLYIKIGSPKSRGRGPNIQYATVNDPEIVSFLMAVWQHFDREMLLYPGSASGFRRRWDSILREQGVPTWHKLTPGSVRGGGCVAAHKRGVQIPDLLWRMRLQHTKTLCYYLQETTAESILPALSNECRTNIRATSTILPFILKAVAQRTA